MAGLFAGGQWINFFRKFCDVISRIVVAYHLLHTIVKELTTSAWSFLLPAPHAAWDPIFTGIHLPPLKMPSPGDFHYMIWHYYWPVFHVPFWLFNKWVFLFVYRGGDVWFVLGDLYWYAYIVFAYIIHVLCGFFGFL